MKNKPSLHDLSALIVDMDGVLWRGETPLPGFADFFAFLRRRGIPFVLATNNARKTPARYVARFARFGVPISEREVMTSSLATAEYLRTRYPPGTPVYVIGQEGIRQALTDAGFTLRDDGAEAVVVGLDFTLTYDKLRRATVLINRGAAFIGTNPDRTFPFEGGLAPGNGAILAALTAATGREPVIVGKPGRVMFDVALRRLDADPARTAMLGDRLETDIAGGRQAGLKTILLLSGVTRPEDVPASQWQPDWVFSGIDALLEAWQTTND